MAMEKLYLILVALVVFLLASRVTSQPALAPGPDSQPLDVNYLLDPEKFLEVCSLFKHITDDNCEQAIYETVIYSTKEIITKDCCKQLVSFGRKCFKAYVNSLKYTSLSGTTGAVVDMHKVESSGADVLRMGDEVYYLCTLKIKE
ncbi:hypothetical protein SLEP1_g27799 [Rubroshorea leprosula]|uniref:Prolamin-like domain-containing protein n=1 Tax=Rubroshorea leprosula TaxID=152421 RepID=A0AAV5JRP6_9ROSI|nr:hypothetical protein SLEP1_g27799 [Rubroshorea leprosula]